MPDHTNKATFYKAYFKVLETDREKAETIEFIGNPMSINVFPAFKAYKGELVRILKLII